MAAAFGVWEVKFPSSRAVYDEEDDEEEELSTLENESESAEFHWRPWDVDQKPLPSHCSLLVLAIGEVAATFVEAHYLSAGSEIVAYISSKKSDEIDFKKFCSPLKSGETSCLYRLTTQHDDDSAVLCQCPTPVPQEKAFHWTEKLLENLKPSKVVILSSAPACDYHTNTPENLKSDFVKVLKTDSWLEKFSQKDCSFLETPNIISGVAASVLQYCQIHNLAAALFVCFMESSCVDSQSVETFKFLLNSPPLNCLRQASGEHVTKVLKSLRSGKLIEMNMYM